MRKKEFFLFFYFILIGVILLFTFFGRYVTEFLRKKGLLRITVYTFFIGFILLFVFLLERKFLILDKRKKRIIMVSFILFLIVLYLFFSSKTPEERVHILEYFLLGFTSVKVGGEKKKALLFFLGFTILFGIFEETLQLYIPRRYFDWHDILLNELSIIFGILNSLWIR